jgi:hypothetical protein
MSLWSAITGTEDQDVQEAQYAAKQQALADAIVTHPANGNPAHDEIVARDQVLLHDSLLDTGFSNSWATRDEGVEKKPGIGDFFVDVLIVAVVAGGAWLFVSMGGLLWVRHVVKKKEWVPLSGLGAGAVVGAWLLWKYGRKAFSDLNSVKDQSLSFFG